MDTKETINMYFVPINLVDMWPRIQGKYEYFKFTDKIDDDTKYDEYIYVLEQLRKYIGGKQAQVMTNLYNLEKMKADIESWLADGSEKISVAKGESIRPRLVYVAMRNEWLQALLFAVDTLMEVEDGSYGVE